MFIQFNLITPFDSRQINKEIIMVVKFEIRG